MSAIQDKAAAAGGRKREDSAKGNPNDAVDAPSIE